MYTEFWCRNLFQSGHLLTPLTASEKTFTTRLQPFLWICYVYLPILSIASSCAWTHGDHFEHHMWLDAFSQGLIYVCTFDHYRCINSGFIAQSLGLPVRGKHSTLTQRAPSVTDFTRSISCDCIIINSFKNIMLSLPVVSTHIIAGNQHGKMQRKSNSLQGKCDICMLQIGQF